MLAEVTNKVIPSVGHHDEGIHAGAYILDEPFCFEVFETVEVIMVGELARSVILISIDEVPLETCAVLRLPFIVGERVAAHELVAHVLEVERAVVVDASRLDVEEQRPVVFAPF